MPQASPQIFNPVWPIVWYEFLSLAKRLPFIHPLKSLNETIKLELVKVYFFICW